MKEKIKSLNQIKSLLVLDGSFKKDLFCKFLKEANFKMVDALFCEFVKRGIIIKAKKGQYTFADEKPIYIGILESVIKEVRAQKAAKVRNYYKRSKTQSMIQEAPKAQLTVEEAVNFLKSLGYKILKPITQYEEL